MASKKDIYPRIFTACFATTAILALHALYFPPMWATNDDVGIAMRAHGFGNSHSASAYTMWGNIIWGFIVHHTPSIRGIHGYSVATLSVVAISLFSWIHIGLQFAFTRQQQLIVLLVSLLCITTPFIFPQFTVNAGLLTVTAALWFSIYGTSGRTDALLISFILAFVGFLIRDKQFLLTFAVAVPFLPWRELLKRPATYLALTLFLTFAYFSALLHTHMYSTQDWEAFNQLQNARLYWMDFGGFSALLREGNGLHEAFGYSLNDLYLLKSWFFVDPNLYNPDTLNSMQLSFEFSRDHSNRMGSGLDGLKALGKPELLPITLASLLTLSLGNRRRTLIAWGIAVAAFFYFGFLGRPGIVRVYLPVLTALTLTPLFISLIKQQNPILPNKLTTIGLLCLVTTNLFVAGEQHIDKSAAANQSRNLIYDDIERYADEKYVVTWGSGFPYETVFPLFGQLEKHPSINLYGLGTSTLNPLSVAANAEASGVGFIQQLFSETGLFIYADERRMNWLRTYCLERHNAKLYEEIERATPEPALFKVRCEK